jgi:hypothetical protein
MTQDLTCGLKVPQNTVPWMGFAGDAQELGSIDAVYGAGDAGRTAEDPLLIGSVKSNMGHCEAGSGLAGDDSAFFCQKVQVNLQIGISS